MANSLLLAACAARAVKVNPLPLSRSTRCRCRGQPVAAIAGGDRGLSRLRPALSSARPRTRTWTMTSDAEIQTALPAFASGNVAVITGGASGIGLAAAKRFALMGMKTVLADIGGVRLDQAKQAVAAIAGDDAVLPIPTDVSKADEVDRLAE